MIHTFYAHKYKEYGSDKEFFNDIYSNSCCVKMCSDAEREIFKLHFSVTDEPDDDCYWGWHDFKHDEICMIYPHKILFSMCFPYGEEAEIKAKRGNIVRLKIEKIEVLI